MSIFPAPARPLLALLGTAAALGLAASPADAATAGKSHKTATASNAKAKAKPKAKVKKAAPKGKADLAVKNIHIDVSDEGTLLVSANLLNIGNVFAGPSTTVIALSDDTTYDESDDTVLDELDYTRVGASVKRGIDDEVDVPLDVDTSEDLYLLVCADAERVVAEKSETNNCASQSVVLDDVVADDSTDDVSDDGSDQTDSADESDQ